MLSQLDGGPLAHFFIAFFEGFIVLFKGLWPVFKKQYS
jgi:hypothetical protein